MRRNVEFNGTKRVFAMFLAIVMVLSIVPIGIFAVNPGELYTDIGTKEFTVGEATEFTVTTKANDDAEKTVIGSFDFSDADAIEKLEYKESKDGNWYEFSGEFGPENGFPLSDATSYFRVTFKKTGSYNVKIYVKPVNDKDTVLCSAEADITVNGGSYVSTNVEEKVFVVGESTEFEFTTFANDDYGKWVIGLFKLSDNETVEKIEYKQSKEDDWSEIKYWKFGHDFGFPLVDSVTSRFRATFKKAGTYSATFCMKDADTRVDVCSIVVTIIVKERSEISFEKDAITIKYTDSNAYNDSLTDSVQGAEYIYQSENKNIVEVHANGILIPKGIGETTIFVTRKENDFFVEATASYTVKVIPGTQSDLVWNNTVPTTIKWTESYSNTVSGGLGEGEITYESNHPEIAEVNEKGELTLKRPGTVTITATKAGGTLYEDATASYTIEVTKADQSPIAFEQSHPDAIEVGETYSNTITGDDVHGTIVYESDDDDETIATVDESGKITALRVPMGQETATVTITAFATGDDYYEASKPVSYTITIKRAPQKTPISFQKGSENQKMTYGQQYTNAAQGGDTLSFEYQSSDKTIATVDNEGNVTALKAGTVTITVTANESEQYLAQTMSYELVIERANQTVIFADSIIPAMTYGVPYQNIASAETAIEYNSDDETVATVDSNGNVTALKAGKVKIYAVAKETEQYNAAEAFYEITINKANQVISFEKGNKTEVTFNDNGNKFSNTASTNSEDDVTVTYEIESGANLVENFNSENGEFTILGAGEIKIKVIFGGNDRYNEASASYTLTVKKAKRSIAFYKDGTLLNENSVVEMTSGDPKFKFPYVVNPETKEPEENIFYSFVDENEEKVIDSINSATGEIVFTYISGTVTICATQKEDENYEKAEASYQLKVVYAQGDVRKYYTILGDKKDPNSGWYTGTVTIKANEGCQVGIIEYFPSFIEWSDQIYAGEDGIYSNTIFLAKDANGFVYWCSENIKVDSTAPEVSILHKRISNWEKFLSIITLDITKLTKMQFYIECEDKTSGVDKESVEYYIADGTVEVIKSKEELDKFGWESYTEPISVPCDKKFVVYARAKDVAGNWTYTSTNGIIFDKTPVAEDGIVVDLPDDINGYYKDDVKIGVSVTDMTDVGVSSGIKSITYEVWKDKDKTQEEEVLFSFSKDNPEYEDLVFSWNSADENKYITVESSINNSDNVRVIIKVVDNYGSVTTKEIPLKIYTGDISMEVIYKEVTSKKEPVPNGTYDDVDYYNTSFEAKIIFTGRKSVFEMMNSPEINVTESVGKSTYEVIGRRTLEGGDPDKATHEYIIRFNGNAHYNFTVNYTDIFGNKSEYDSGAFVVDNEKPTANITIDDYSWSTPLLNTLTFGLWKNETVTIKATPSDLISPIKKIEMYKTDSTQIKTYDELNALYNKGAFVEYQDLDITEDEKFVVYIRVEDHAGNSDGFVVDTTKSEVTLTPDHTELYHGGIPLYYGDVDVRIDVAENKKDSYSGIKEVKYWVTCDDVITQPEEVLYSFEYLMDDYPNDAPVYKELKHSFSETVTIDSAKNNDCYVVLHVMVTDNAGNVAEEECVVDIDITAPDIYVEYDNNVPKKIVGDRGYYPENRTATVVITERTGHFNAEKAVEAIKIKALDFYDDPIVVNGVALSVDKDGYLTDISELFGALEWNTKEYDAPNAATHTLVLPFIHDANYEFTLSYEDLATNKCEYDDVKFADGTSTPRYFTVDKLNPTASVSIESQTWDKLLETLTFGLYSNDDVNVIVERNDVTSPIESVLCYKTDRKTIMSNAELEAISEWKNISEELKFTVAGEQTFTVYFKITDCAGNYTYISSDGYIIDDEPAAITLTPEYTELYHDDIPLYIGDVDVRIDVVENKALSYSGIKEVKYWVTCDGVETKAEEVLYSFDYSMSDYPAKAPAYKDLRHEFSTTVTIDSNANNGCKVVLHVMVTDNAGNVSTNEVVVDIDITDPTIYVEFDNNISNKIAGERGYYPANRTARVVITERPEHFDAKKATESIKISAVDFYGVAIMEDCSVLVSEWITNGTGNEATHTARVDFSADANYEFTLSYEDLATRRCEYDNVKFAVGAATPRYFTVDKLGSTGEVTVRDLGTWDKIIETLTFGLWSKETVDVTGVFSDATSPMEPVLYYKTSDTVAKTYDELNGIAITEWKEFDLDNGFSVSPSEQFVVYIRLVDYAGNVEYISTDGIVVDNREPSFETVKPEISITPEPTHGIYNSDVAIGVYVTEPKIGATEAFAGIKEISYEVHNLDTNEITQQGILYKFELLVEDGKNILKIYGKEGVLELERKDYTPVYEDLLPEWKDSSAIIVDSELNNSNNVKIVVKAIDNADNINIVESNIMIDITPAKIDVTYDNNDGDTSFADATYFKANRTAKIVVTERNFDSEAFKHTITNAHGYVTEISAWETKKGTLPNGDDTTHTATVIFNRDGDYKFSIESCIDIAMNDNEAPNTGDTLAPWEFTIDKTAPVVNVSYDNNDVLNGNYYKAQRIATITVTEHNFETVSGRLKIKLLATDDGVDSALPTVSNWATKGDVHTLTITYAADSRYVFDFDYTDKAGNATADIAEQTFYVDKTNPVLSIEKIVDESANNDEGNIGFVMTATDTNFDVFTPILTGVIKNGDAFETKQFEIGEMTDIKNGKVFTVKNIDADGIYRITCTLVDKAGNAYSEVTLDKADGTKYVEKRAGKDTLVTFSVNRDGSTFEIDENTVALINQYYIQNVKNDVVIVEINADPLKEYGVTLNGKSLEKDKDYTVTEEGGDGAWMKYTYTVNKDLFADEGEYKIVVSSKDKADNDAFSDVKEAAVEFVVDRTAPVVTVSGIADNGRYQTEKHLVTLIPTDDGGALRTLIVNLVDKDGKVINELVNLTGEALINELEANEGKITFEIGEGLYQNVQVICTDCATEEKDDETNTLDTTVKNVSVSSNVLMIFWANKPLRWATIGGVSAAAIALVIFLILKKKKKKDDK